MPNVNTVDPIGGASALMSASGVQIILISCMLGIVILFWVAFCIGGSADARDFSLFTKHPANYIRRRDFKNNNAGKFSSASEFKRMLASKHLLYQVYDSKPYSTLTRPQILTVLFCYIASSMTANAIFYGKEPSDATEALLRGVLSSLITIPSTVFFIMFFRNIRRRQAKQAKAAQTQQQVELQRTKSWRSVFGLGRSSSVEPLSGTVVPSSSGSAARRQSSSRWSYVKSEGKDPVLVLKKQPDQAARPGVAKRLMG
eukprot:1396408-Rhodomonas_salina.1